MNLSPEIIEVLLEVESLNFRTSLKKISVITQSQDYEKYSNFEKSILYLYQILCYDFIWDFEKKSETIKEFLKTFGETTDTDADLTRLIFHTIKMRENNITNNYNNLLENIETIRNSFQTAIKKVELSNITLLNSFLSLFTLSTNLCLVKLEQKDKINLNIDEITNEAIESNFSFVLLVNYLDLSLYLRPLGFQEQIGPYLRKLKTHFEKTKNVIYENYILSLMLSESLYSHSNLFITKNLIDEGTEKINQLTGTDEITNELKCWFYTFDGMYNYYICNLNNAVLNGEKAQHYAKLLYDEFGTISDLASAMNNIGEAYFKLGNMQLALKYQNDAYSLRKDNSSPQDIAESFYQLLKIYLRESKWQQAEKTINLFNTFIEKQIRMNTPFLNNIEAQYKISRAKYLLRLKSFKTISEAKDLLREAMKLRAKMELQYDALIILIDISVQEYKVFENDKNFETIKDLITTLGKMSEKNPSVEFQIHSLVLQGKLALILGLFDDFQKFLLKAEDLANDYELIQLKEAILNELEDYEKEIKKWQNMLLNNISMVNRLEMANMESYIKEIHSLQTEYTVKEDGRTNRYVNKQEEL